MHRKRISSPPPPLPEFMPLPGPSHTLPTTPGSSMGLRGRETLPSFLAQGIIRAQFVGSGRAGGWCLEKKGCPSARPPGRDGQHSVVLTPGCRPRGGGQAGQAPWLPPVQVGCLPEVTPNAERRREEAASGCYTEGSCAFASPVGGCRSWWWDCRGWAETVICWKTR